MIDWLYGLRHLGVKLGLDNIRALLDLLDRPDRGFRSVHVAGTNGKGSVASMVDAMLLHSCVPSGLFTSPHLIRPHERIRLSGADIADEELHRRLAAMRDRIGQGLADGRLAVHPSFFEVVTATALEAFRDHGLHVAVLEVGLGGRLDATNAVDTDVCVITGVDLDHTKTLGGTLESIAGEKAGIIKEGRPLVTGAVQQVVVDVLRRACRERGAEWIDARVAARLVADRGDLFSVRTARADYSDLRPALPGRHQIDNARIAIVAFELMLERLGLEPDPEAVRDALAAVRWPGRLQWVDGTPRLLIDAAHNPAGVAALVHYVESLPDLHPVILFGVTSGKPVERLLAPLSRFSRSVVVTAPAVERGIGADEVAALARPHFDRVEIAADAERGLAAARDLAGPQGTVLVTGSLYLVGEVLGLLSGEKVPGPVGM